MDDLEEYKVEAEAQFAQARRYGDLNPEYWARVYRALRRENTLWLNLGRVPAEKRTVEPDITQRLTAALENVSDRSSTASTDSGITRESATPIDTDSNMPKRVKRKAPRRTHRSREESPRVRLGRAVAAQAQGSKSEVINQAEPSALGRSIDRPSPEKKRVMKSARQRSKPSRPSNTLPSKGQKQRKQSTGGPTKDTIQHRPVTRSQAAATKPKALATKKEQRTS